jgi:hypothetical protein
MAGFGIGIAYLVLCAYLILAFGLSFFVFLVCVAGGLSLAYSVGFLGPLLNPAFVRATLKNPNIVLSIGLLSASYSKVRGWYRFPIRVEEESDYSQEASHLWIRAASANMDAIVGPEAHDVHDGQDPTS